MHKALLSSLLCSQSLDLMVLVYTAKVQYIEDILIVFDYSHTQLNL